MKTGISLVNAFIKMTVFDHKKSRINIEHNHDHFVNILFIQVKKGETYQGLLQACAYM